MDEVGKGRRASAPPRYAFAEEVQPLFFLFHHQCVRA